MSETEANPRSPAPNEAEAGSPPTGRVTALVAVALSVFGALVALTLLTSLGGAIASGSGEPGLLVLSPLPLVLLTVSGFGLWFGVGALRRVPGRQPG